MKVFLRAFELEKRGEFLVNQIEMKGASLAGEDALGIEPILVSTGENFVDEEIFGRTGSKLSFSNVPQGRTVDSILFEGRSMRPSDSSFSG